MIRTLGHGTLAEDAFAALVTGAGIDVVVDVRRYPGSRRNPQFGQDAMAAWLPAHGVDYRWVEALGGRRATSAGSPHVALRNEQFRGYADHMETEEFCAAVRELLDLASSASIAVMCSESVWWRCHRRLLADHVVLVERVDVDHLAHDGRTGAHPVTDGARLDGNRVVYDASPEQLRLG